MEKVENCIVIENIQYDFIVEKIKDRELCFQCDLKKYCFERLKADNLICNIHIDNVKIFNGSYKIHKNK